MYFCHFLISPWKNGVALHLKKIESPSPKDALCQVWLKLAQWFWRRRWKVNRWMDRRTDNRKQVIRKAHWAFSWWAKNRQGEITSVSWGTQTSVSFYKVHTGCIVHAGMAFTVIDVYFTSITTVSIVTFAPEEIQSSGSVYRYKNKKNHKQKCAEFSNFLPESSMVQYFTNPIETWIYEASIDFVFTFVPVESGRTHTSVVLEVNALTGSTILTGFSLTSITFPHHFWIWGAWMKAHISMNSHEFKAYVILTLYRFMIGGYFQKKWRIHKNKSHYIIPSGVEFNTLSIKNYLFFYTILKHLTITLHKLTLLKTASCHTPANLFTFTVTEKHEGMRASLDLPFQRWGPL